MGEHWTISPALPGDLPEIVDLILSSFSPSPLEDLLGHTDTPEGRQQAVKDHLQSWREHEQEVQAPSAIKATYTEPLTGETEITGFAYWYIYDKVRTEDEYKRPPYLLSGAWLPEDQREKVRKVMQPLFGMRNKWFGGQRYGVLMYMCVKKRWRLQGVSSAIVRSGLQRCKQLGIPACLEASEQGQPVYERLGFTVVDHVTMGSEGEMVTYPFMVRWPTGPKGE